ncbi:MAG: tetratricopeptide repeat protein [Acidobacteriota bacterium]|nr:tetratricopeptide repeat protein [Acidobacteriota bacterium]
MADETNSDALSSEQIRDLEQGTLAASSRLPAWWGIAIVLALTFAVYIPTLRYQFVHDDRGQIVENPAVHSWHSVPTYFTAHVWAAVMPEELGNYYRPLFLLWLRINDAVFGTQAWGWHLTTILAHVLATLLVYLLALRLGIGRDVALLAALIFGLHPAHIEAVAWISGVTEPLLGILLIASFLAYVEGRDEQAHALKWRAISLILFALAILEKETALMLPGLLLFYEWIFRREWEQRAGVRRVFLWGGEAFGKIWPYILIIVIYVPARIHALKGFSHAITPLSTAQLVFTWPSLIAFWVCHLIWPAGLSTFYDFPAVTHPTVRSFLLPAIFDVLVGLALLACARRSRKVAFFAVWLVLPLIPLLNLRVFVANDFAHDRYLYLPSVGFAVLIAMLLKKMCWGPPRWLGIPTSLFVAGLCLATALSYGTVTESSYFRDNLTFYAYNLSKAPHNPDAECNYATVLAEGGMYGPALERFTDVVNHNPNNWTAIYDLAFTYYKMGNMPEAERYFLQSIRLNPNKPDQYFYLGMARFKSGRTAEAIDPVRQAIVIRPNGFAYHFALGVMLKTLGDLPGALQEFKMELANNPGEQAAAAQVDEIEKQLQARPETGK